MNNKLSHWLIPFLIKAKSIGFKFYVILDLIPITIKLRFEMKPMF